MENLFRLVLKRPATSQNEDAPSILLAQESQFQAALGIAENSNEPRKALKETAQEFIATPVFVGNPKTIDVYTQLKILDKSLLVFELKEDVSNEEISNVIHNAFGATPAEIIEQKILDSPISSIKDSLIAIKLLPSEHQRPIEELTNQLRDLELIVAVASNKSFPKKGKFLRQYRKRSLMLPTDFDLKSSLSTVEKQKELEEKRKKDEAKKKEAAERKLDLYNQLKASIKELTSFGEEYFYNTPQKENGGFLVDQEHRPTKILIKEKEQLGQYTKFIFQRAKTVAARLEEGKSSQFSIDVSSESKSVKSLLAQARLFQSGSPSFKPLQLNEIGFRLNATAESSLTENTLWIFKKYGINISNQPIDKIVEVLRENVTQLGKELDALFGQPTKHSFKRVGNALIMIKSPMPSVWNNIVVGTNTITAYPLLWDSRVPHSHGSIMPVGVADLLIVKQQLIRYEGTDVAHIENILKGEKKEREHTRRRETEELLFNEIEITTSEERELESTNRFEMSRETSEVIKEDAALKAGLSVSGSYGPFVEFSVTAEGSVSRSKEQATKAASKFSQDVTQRSENKVTERVLERSSLRVTNEVIEKNGHSLDNSNGGGHISGVYQWVTKVYQAQMYNYGIRTMYDFMVPEPGAFLIEALQSAHANAIEIEKPMVFTLRPNQITESNYHTWVREYGATDITPPPEIYITKSLDFKAGGGDSNTHYNHSGQIQIDDGYKAIHAVVGSVRNIWEDDYNVNVVLGNRSHRFESGDWVWSTSLSGERDSIPFALQTWGVSYIAAIVEVKCQRTERAKMKWRLNTHAKLTNAYKARLSEYEEQLAALELQAGVEIEGQNPALNLELMKDELKKNCISILTEQHFDLFNAITSGSNGLPQINLSENEAEGIYVRFFEQAFEWEHMTWVTYPYFWGRKNQWDERIAYEDSDPLFNQFLKAGYCRVAVPARVGFEGALDHFMTYGELWNGGALPAISNPLYLPIADEIAERLDRPDGEIPQGDSWEVRVPTSLIKLRADDKLPIWEKDDDGKWIESE